MFVIRAEAYEEGDKVGIAIETYAEFVTRVKAYKEVDEVGIEVEAYSVFAHRNMEM